MDSPLAGHIMILTDSITDQAMLIMVVIMDMADTITDLSLSTIIELFNGITVQEAAVWPPEVM